MDWKPTKPYQAPAIIDSGASLVIIIGYFLVHTYCQYLFLGPCDRSGRNFSLGIGLMIAGSATLAAFRTYRARNRVVLARILVFTEGTVIKEAKGEDDSMVGGIILGDAASKLSKWGHQGARIMYLTSKQTTSEIDAVRRVLKQFRFPKGQLFYRQAGEEYEDVAERVRPDVLVEDDRGSIGGEVEMTHPHVMPAPKEGIKSIVVRKFGGIDHLPDNVSELMGL